MTTHPLPTGTHIPAAGPPTGTSPQATAGLAGWAARSAAPVDLSAARSTMARLRALPGTERRCRILAMIEADLEAGETGR